MVVAKFHSFVFDGHQAEAVEGATSPLEPGIASFSLAANSSICDFASAYADHRAHEAANLLGQECVARDIEAQKVATPAPAGRNGSRGRPPLFQRAAVGGEVMLAHDQLGGVLRGLDVQLAGHMPGPMPKQCRLRSSVFNTV